MTIKKYARVITHDNNSTLIQIDGACTSCSGCVHQKPSFATIEGTFSNQVELELTLGEQVRGVFYSLLLPLLLGLSFAFIAEILHLNEIIGIISTVCGFSLGMLLCRQIQSSALLVKELFRG